ncbi:hypothetical protein BDZ89DRAFT_1132663 [Hymenopellis radicata]|nr:hypothetical protein BDZ89DRAFT_1132663 [Hymenopellis radicata]
MIISPIDSLPPLYDLQFGRSNILHPSCKQFVELKFWTVEKINGFTQNQYVAVYSGLGAAKALFAFLFNLEYILLRIVVFETPSATWTAADNDFEEWSARAGNRECLMGHKQWYKYRKPNADCYVGKKFIDRIEHEDTSPCVDKDYECEFNFVRDSNKLIRKIPGYTCTGGTKDALVDKKCSQAPEEGQVLHQTGVDSTTFNLLVFDSSRYILFRHQPPSKTKRHALPAPRYEKQL